MLLSTRRLPKRESRIAPLRQGSAQIIYFVNREVEFTGPMAWSFFTQPHARYPSRWAFRATPSLGSSMRRPAREPGLCRAGSFCVRSASSFFSAFYSLLFQIEGLIGPRGVLPAEKFLNALRSETGSLRFWYAPSLFWISSGEHMMMAVTWLGLIASIAAFLNLWPRLSFFVCLICFLSFITAAEAFSSYQSDGMLLEAGFLALFFVPRGLLPGLGIASPTSRASLFLLQWEWFRIYFESGIVKLLSGDPEWRNYNGDGRILSERPVAPPGLDGISNICRIGSTWPP